MKTVEFSTERPCPSWHDRLLDYAAHGESYQRTRSVQKHLSACPRCRGYVSNTRLIQRGVRGLKFPREPARGAWRHPVSARFERWLDGVFETKSANDLARVAGRLACHCIRADTGARDSFVVPEEEDVSPLEALAAGAADARRSASRKDSLPRSVADPLRRVVDVVERELSPVAVNPRRASAAFVVLARDIAGSENPHVLLAEALDAWHFGDSGRVPDLLSNATDRSIDAQTRAKALNSLAVWMMDQGEVARALGLSQRALALAPTLLPLLRDRLIWLHLIGDDTGREATLQLLSPVLSTTRFRALLPLARLATQVRACQELMGCSPVRVREILRLFRELSGAATGVGAISDGGVAR